MTKREIKIGDGWILAKFLFAFLFVKVIKMQKRQGQERYSHDLDQTNLANKGFIIWPKRELSLGGLTRKIQSPILPAHVATQVTSQNAGFALSCSLTVLGI